MQFPMQNAMNWTAGFRGCTADTASHAEAAQEFTPTTGDGVSRPFQD